MGFCVLLQVSILLYHVDMKPLRLGFVSRIWRSYKWQYLTDEGPKGREYTKTYKQHHHEEVATASQRERGVRDWDGVISEEAVGAEARGVVRELRS